MAMLDKFQFKRWDTISIQCEFTNEDWTPIDITWYEVKFGAKRNDTIAIVKTVVTHTDPINGKTVIIITASEASNLELWTYKFDIQITKDWVVTSSTDGLFSIVRDTTP